MPSSGKKKLLLNVVPILGMQENVPQLYLTSGESTMQMPNAAAKCVRTCTHLLSQAG